MIRLAANGSRILAELLDSTDLPLDYVKCPLSANSRDEVDRFRRFRPLLLHGWGPAYWICRPEIPEPELLRQLIQVGDSPYISTHFQTKPGDFDELPDVDTLLRRTTENVAALRDVAGAYVLIENVPYITWRETARFLTDPELITAAVEASGAGLLLDIAHARVSAWHRGEDFDRYIAGLPLERVVELHLSRPGMEPAGLRDWHLGLQEEDYAYVSMLIPRLPALRMVALEYGGLGVEKRLRDGTPITVRSDDPRELRDQIGRLKAILTATG